MQNGIVCAEKPIVNYKKWIFKFRLEASIGHRVCQLVDLSVGLSIGLSVCQNIIRSLIEQYK